MAKILIIYFLLLVCLLLYGKYNYQIGILAEKNPFSYNYSNLNDIKIPLAFKLNKTFPANDQLDVKLNKKISATFNQPVNNSAVKNDIDNFIMIKGKILDNNMSNLGTSKIIKGKHTVSDDNRTISFIPNSNLDPNTIYTAVILGKEYCQSTSNINNNTKISRTITNQDFSLPIPLLTNTSTSTKIDSRANHRLYTCAITDSSGNVLNQSHFWSFTTILSPPTISKPHNNSTINTKSFTILGTDPNHASNIKVYKMINSNKNSKLKEMGSDTPSLKGDWSVKVNLRDMKDGQHRFVAMAFDSSGNKNSKESNSLKLIVDTTAPVVTVPNDIIWKGQSDFHGVPVTFQSNATDNLDGQIKTTCSPLKSGSIFPIGNTKVTCKAIDDAKNKGTASFSVNVSSLNSLVLTCSPSKLVIKYGSEASLNCRVENKTPKSLELNLVCSRLEETGVKCYINGSPRIATINVKERSYQTFDVHVSANSMQKISPGLFPFTISANCKDNSC